MSVLVRVRDPRLAARIDAATELALGVARADADARAATTAGVPVVRLRTRRRLAALGPEAIRDAIVVVEPTERTHRLAALVDDVRAAGAAGVQIVWNGALAKERIEPQVFAALERARATPKDPPVVLASRAVPTRALRVLIAHRIERLRDLRERVRRESRGLAARKELLG